VGPPLSCSISQCADFTASLPWNPSKARLGIARALGNAHLPYQFVNEHDIRNGLLAALPSLKVLVMPHVLGMSTDLLEAIADWVQRGGRVVVDQPWLLYDNTSTVVDQSLTVMAGVLGAYVQNYQNTYNGYNLSTAGGVAVDGQYADLVLTTAAVVQTFDSGEPAVTDNTYGAGSGAIINFEASRMNWLPTGGLDAFLALIVTRYGALQPPYSVLDTGAGGQSPVQAYRRVVSYNGTTADHWFMVNDRATPHNVTITVTDRVYSAAANAGACAGSLTAVRSPPSPLCIPCGRLQSAERPCRWRKAGGGWSPRCQHEQGYGCGRWQLQRGKCEAWSVCVTAYRLHGWSGRLYTHAHHACLTSSRRTLFPISASFPRSDPSITTVSCSTRHKQAQAESSGLGSGDRVVRVAQPAVWSLRRRLCSSS